ncbi:MAG: acyl-CoA dehydrogenase family protein [Acidimicrobiales bacterium]
MAIDFEVEPEFQEKLDWIDQFVKTEVEPLDLYFRGEVSPFDKGNEVAQGLVRPLQRQVQEQELWACHIGPELGGRGYGQVKLAMMNELLGRSSWAPSVFGCQAPDSGNAEVLAHYGNDEQKARYLEPLLRGEISTTYAMTEPQAGSDPNYFTCQARRDGDEWVISGEKWFASNFAYAEFLIVMLITNPDVPVYKGSSMMLVPADAPGLELVRNVHLGTGTSGDDAGHAYLRFNDVRVPAENLLGEEGSGFKIAQTRLGGGRVHHGMRSVGMAQRALDMMCERVLSRETKGSLIADKQAIQHWIADSWVQIQQFRLQVLHTAWLIDKDKEDKERNDGKGDYGRIRQHIAGVKVATPKVLMDVVYRSLHAHGSLGVSNEMPLAGMWMATPVMGIADGPTEVHKDTIAKSVLKAYRPYDGLFPSQHIPARTEAPEPTSKPGSSTRSRTCDPPRRTVLRPSHGRRGASRQPSVTIDEGWRRCTSRRRAPADGPRRRSDRGRDRAPRAAGESRARDAAVDRQSTTISRRAIANLFYRGAAGAPGLPRESVATVVTVAGLADGSHKEAAGPAGKVLVDIVTTASGLRPSSTSGARCCPRPTTPPRFRPRRRPGRRRTPRPGGLRRARARHVGLRSTRTCDRLGGGHHHRGPDTR